MANQAKFGETQFSVGDTVVVHQKIIEGKKERATTFEGIVISVRGKGENKTFTVRRIATGEIGVERIWPLSSPWISKIKVIKKGKVRRAKLYYLKRRAGKKAIKIKAKNDGVKRGQNRVERDEKKPRRPRRKSRLKTSKR